VRDVLVSKIPTPHVKLCAGVILWPSFRLRLWSGVSSFQSEGRPRSSSQGP